MQLEKGLIPSSGLTMLMIGFIFGSTVILPPGREAAQDAWIAVILGTVEGMLIARLYIALSLRFPGKTFVEIAEIVYGPVPGKLVALFLMWFLFHLGSLVLDDFGRYFTALILPETPDVVFMLLIVLSCAYAVKHGIEVITRTSQVLVPIAIFFTFFVTVLLVNKLDLKNLQPVFETPLPKLFWAGHAAATFPFAETVAFVMVLPYLNNKHEAHPAVFKGMLFAGAILVMTVVRNTAVLGATAELFIYPSSQATRLINIAEVFTRLEAIIAYNFLTMGFLKIAVLLYGTVLGAAQLFKLKTYRPLIIPTSILMLVQAKLNYDNTPAMVHFAQNVYPIYAVPFEIGLPLLTLLIAIARKLPQGQGKPKDKK